MQETDNCSDFFEVLFASLAIRNTPYNEFSQVDARVN